MLYRVFLILREGRQGFFQEINVFMSKENLNSL